MLNAMQGSFVGPNAKWLLKTLLFGAALIAATFALAPLAEALLIAVAISCIVAVLIYRRVRYRAEMLKQSPADFEAFRFAGDRIGAGFSEEDVRLLAEAHASRQAWTRGARRRFVDAAVRYHDDADDDAID